MTFRQTLISLLPAAVLVVLSSAAAPAHAQPSAPPMNECATCHAALPDPALAEPVAALQQDVHHQQDFTCAECHGGDATSADLAVAKGPESGYQGASVTGVCGSCHVIFEQKFAASVHQPVFDRGCVECHGNHGVLPPAPEMLGTSDDSICSMCHAGADDPGYVAAGRMREDLDRLRAQLDSTTALIDRAHVAGMEVGAQQLALAEARSQLMLARTEIHGFSPDAVEPIVGQGLTLLAEVERAGHAALDELAYRRRGLAVSLGVILLLVVALAVKIRRLDRELHVEH